MPIFNSLDAENMTTIDTTNFERTTIPYSRCDSSSARLFRTHLGICSHTLDIPNFACWRLHRFIPILLQPILHCLSAKIMTQVPLGLVGIRKERLTTHVKEKTKQFQGGGRGENVAEKNGVYSRRFTAIVIASLCNTRTYCGYIFPAIDKQGRN